MITPTIIHVRDRPVILDSDLARIYGVSTKALNQAIKRNKRRFPPDFMFRLTAKEAEAHRSQIMAGYRKPKAKNLRSQIVTSSWGGQRYRPYAFTEQGAVMAANVLNSVAATRMSVFVVRAFVRMRALLLGDKGLAAELRKLERKLTKRLDIHETAIVNILQRVMQLLEPPPEEPDPEKPPIGFQP